MEKPELVQELENLWRTSGEPMPEAEMIKQSLDAGSYYIKTKYKDAPLTDQTIAMNACAHGFCMAVRWYEKNRLETTPETKGTAP
jgi:hypothetical protein